MEQVLLLAAARMTYLHGTLGSMRSNPALEDYEKEFRLWGNQGAQHCCRESQGHAQSWLACYEEYKKSQ